MNHPKIGIRPTIDGRGTVRHTLEIQTMNMAKAAAALISGSLKYPDGCPVECVIADGTIGGGAEAAAAAGKFAKEGVTATLTVTPCWCYGSETIDMDPLTVKAVWGFNGTERPGAVYLAAAMSAHAQRGLPAFSIYGGEVQNADDTVIPDDVKEKLLAFAKGAVAVGCMRNKAYLNIGSVSMGIMGSYCDAEFFQKYLGLRAEWVESIEIMRRIDKGIYDKDEFTAALKWVKENCKEGFDKNANGHSRGEKDKEWEFVVKMAVIVKDMMDGNPRLAELGFTEESRGRNAILGGYQGQRQWTDYLPNGDFMEAILNSSFDWNGKRQPVLIATENDGLNGVAMLLSHLLSGKASIFADVRTYWSPDSIEKATGWRPEGKAANGFIHLINSGAAALDGAGAMTDESGNPVMKPWWDVTDADIENSLAATEWCPADLDYFRGGGYSSRFETKAEMPVTMVRVNLIDGLGPTLQIAEGYTCNLPEQASDILWKRTDYTWPCTWFAPNITGKGAFTDVYSVMANWGSNHGAFTYGHVGGELIMLAAMLRIPVSMHNVDDSRIFRPHAWSAFGTEDKENADYRACANYGPLYK